MNLPPEAETVLSDWRARLQRAGITSRTTLAELESHLRDGIADRLEQGLHPQVAADEAISQLGSPDDLKRDLSSVGSDCQFTHLTALWIGVGCVILIALWWSTPWMSLPYKWLRSLWAVGLPAYPLLLPCALVWSVYHAAAWKSQMANHSDQRQWVPKLLRASLWLSGLTGLAWWAAAMDWLLSLVATYAWLILMISQLAALAGWAQYTHWRTKPDFLTTSLLIVTLISAAWTQWPMRLLFHVSHERLNSLANRIESGESIQTPVWAGGFLITRIEKRTPEWGGGTCLWVVPREGGPTGFIRKGEKDRREPGNGINQRIRFGERWYYVSED